MYRKCLLILAWVWLVMPSLAAAEPTRFSVASDTRGRVGFVRILEQMAHVPGGPGQFLITAGDMDPLPMTQGQVESVLGKGFPWYPVVGNHEASVKGGALATDDMAWLRAYYDKVLKGKVNPGPEGTRETTYSFDAGEMHIAIINQYWNGKTGRNSDRKNEGTVVAPLRDWLQKDLQASRKPWKLVVGHEPAYPQPDQDWKVERHGEDALTLDPPLRDAFWSVLEEQGVAVYICAHTHRYSRYQPPGSKVWQIDTAQARATSDWKYDAFVVVTADEKGLEFNTYRDLKEAGKFEVTDALKLVPARTRAESKGEPSPEPKAESPAASPR